MSAHDALQEVLVSSGIRRVYATRIVRAIDDLDLEGGSSDDVAAALLSWRNSTTTAEAIRRMSAIDKRRAYKAWQRAVHKTGMQCLPDQVVNALEQDDVEGQQTLPF